jgi:hypothetical protein
MTATFTLTSLDFARLQKVVMRRFRKEQGPFSWQFALRVLVWFCIGLAGAAYVRAMRDFPELSSRLELIAVLLALALIAIVAMPYVSQAAMRKHLLAPNGAFLSPQTVSISASFISVGSVRGTTVVPWSGLLARAEDEANVYLFIDATQALVLPRAAIAPFASQFEQYTSHLASAA